MKKLKMLLMAVIVTLSASNSMGQVNQPNPGSVKYVQINNDPLDSIIAIDSTKRKKAIGTTMQMSYDQWVSWVQTQYPGGQFTPNIFLPGDYGVPCTLKPYAKTYILSKTIKPFPEPYGVPYLFVTTISIHYNVKTSPTPPFNCYYEVTQYKHEAKYPW